MFPLTVLQVKMANMLHYYMYLPLNRLWFLVKKVPAETVLPLNYYSI